MNKNILGSIKSFVIYCSILAFAIYGYVYGHEGAQNVMMFVTGFCALVNLYYFSDKAIEILAKEPRALPEWLSFLFDISIILTVVWHGAIFVGVAWAFASVMFLGARAKADELRKEQP